MEPLPTSEERKEGSCDEVEICLTVQNELHNIGKSLSCPLCLSTLRSPTLLPCNHAFCKSCLLESFDPKNNRTISAQTGKSTFRNQCPICKISCTKRGMTESEHLATLVKAYKKALRSFGLIPIIYDDKADIAMTQIEDTIDFDYCEGDVDVRKIDAAPSLQQVHENLEVSKGVTEHLKRSLKSIERNDSTIDPLSNVGDNTEKQEEMERINKVRKLTFLLQDQEKVVKVNERALVRAAVSKQKRRSKSSERLNVGIIAGDHNESESKDACVEKVEEGTKQVTKDEGDRIIFKGGQSAEERMGKVKAGTYDIIEEQIEKCDNSQNSEEQDEEMFENTQHRVHRAMSAIEESALLLAQGPESQTFFSVPEQDNDSHCCERIDPKCDVMITTQDIMDEVREKEAADRSGEWLEQEAELEERLHLPENISKDDCDRKSKHDIQPKSRQIRETSEDRFFSANSQQESQILLNPSNKKEKEHFPVGTIARVADRTWPGVNKQGGVARIVKVHANFDSGVKYDVSYVLGGREKMVDSAFVRIQDGGPFIDEAHSLTRERSEDDTDQKTPARKSRRVDEKKQVEEWIAKIDAEEESRVKEDESKASKRSTSSITTAVLAEDKNEKPLKANDNESTMAPKDNEVVPPEDIALSKDVDHILRFMSFQDILECALTCYKDLLMKDIGKKRTVFITTSSLPEKDQSSVKTMVRELSSKEVKFKILKDFNPFKTHVLVVSSSLGESNENVAKLRTMKTMRAALAGIPIVDTTWCDACIASKEIVFKLDHLVTSLPTKIPLFMKNVTDVKSIYDKPRDLSTATFGVPSLATCRRSGHDVLLFQNVYFFLAGSTWKRETTKNKDVQLLVKEGGGSVITSAAQATKIVNDEVKESETRVVILCDESDKDTRSGITKVLAKAVRDVYNRPIDQIPVLTVDSAWLFDSISCSKILLAEEYSPKNPIGISLWHLGK